MGNKKNSVKWLPADRLRIMAFARSLAPGGLGMHAGQEPKALEIQDALYKLAHPVEISATTINNWLVGKKLPSKAYVNLIKQVLPDRVDWLKPDIDSSPILRFLCALDIWGSPIDSPVRKLHAASTNINVGKVLTVLAKRWASVPIGADELSGFAIPLLKCPVPYQVPDTVYQSVNLLTVMDFMFRCGAYVKLSDEMFKEWAIDLASLALVIGAFFEGVSRSEWGQSGRTGDYSSLVFDIFFRPYGRWPNLGTVRGRLDDFPEFDDLAIDCYAQRLILACEVLSKELLSLGSNLSIVREIFDRIKDRNKMQHELLRVHGGVFDQANLIRVGRNISRAASGMCRYELRLLSDGKRIALCHDIEVGTQTPLPVRSDLFTGNDSSISWGYSGHGPVLLTVSILAHYFGHDDFGFEEINLLLNTYISRIPERFIETSFFLSTELIDKCLYE